MSPFPSSSPRVDLKDGRVEQSSDGDGDESATRYRSPVLGTQGHDGGPYRLGHCRSGDLTSAAHDNLEEPFLSTLSTHDCMTSQVNYELWVHVNHENGT